MMMRKPLLMMGFLCAGPAMAQSEQLMFLPPAADWIVASHDVKEGVETTRMVPPGQTAQNWSDMIIVELIPGKMAPDAQAVLNGLVDKVKNNCDDLGAGPPQLASENGYETAQRPVACPKTKDQQRGLIGLYKVIAGRDRIYFVGRTRIGKAYDKDKIPLPPQTSDEWLAFMKTVTVCDPRERTHPCPLAK